jgi:PHD/YefM family antitoxin component YafN of YafNO toxin-antitoxin module
VGRTECRRSVDESARSVHTEVYFPSRVAAQPPSIRIRTDELRTVREAMRDFGSLLEELEAGEVEKLVLTQRNRMRAVVVSVERWSEVEQALDGARGASAGRATGSGSVR